VRGPCYRMRVMQKKRIVMVQKSRLGEERGRSFDLEFWRRLGPEARVAAMWDLVLDRVRMGKLDEKQLRLQRSHIRVLRRGG
jgi:hypothetical protein